jgi:hypothetical protein
MVPKRMDARWRAFPAPGPSSSEESSSLSEPTTDQSSSSGRTREVRPIGWVWIGSGARALSCCWGRKNGLLVATPADEEAESPPDCVTSFLNGFLVSASDGGLATGRGVFCAA